MFCTIQTFALEGISARPVRIEVDIHRGLPSFAIVGLPDAAARETRERVRVAVVNSGFEFPLTRIVVNVAPGSVRRPAPAMDLAIVAALLVASGQVDLPGGPRSSARSASTAPSRRCRGRSRSPRQPATTTSSS